MKQLKTDPIYRTYYVNSNIIYEIKNSIAPTSDTHAVIYKKGSSFPLITFSNKKTEIVYKYYLDSLIEDGDKLNGGVFTKVCHEFTGEPEKTPFEYFKSLCEKQIASIITDSSNNRDYSFYYDPDNNINRLSLLGVPEYMFAQNYDDYGAFKESDGKTTTDVTKSKLIDFTQATYNQLLSDEIYNRTLKAANDVAYQYNKKVKTLELQDR